MTDYKVIEDEGLIKFIKNNTTRQAREVFGIEISLYGFGNEVKIKEENYSSLVEIFLKAKSMNPGREIEHRMDVTPIKQ